MGRYRYKELKHIGERVKELRMKQGKTVEALAFDVEISENSIVDIENGKANPCIMTLIDIACSLGVTLDRLAVEDVSSLGASSVTSSLEIPYNLVEFSEERSLSLRTVRTLLAFVSVVGLNRREVTKTSLDKEEWERYYDSFRPYL